MKNMVMTKVEDTRITKYFGYFFCNNVFFYLEAAKVIRK